MIDPSTETILTLASAAKRREFLQGGSPPHISTLYRYTTAGVKSINGQVVRLEFIKTPRGRRTSVEAIQRFYRALNGAVPSPQGSKNPRAENAMSQLQKLGLA